MNEILHCLGVMLSVVISSLAKGIVVLHLVGRICEVGTHDRPSGQCARATIAPASCSIDLYIYITCPDDGSDVEAERCADEICGGDCEYERRLPWLADKVLDDHDRLSTRLRDVMIPSLMLAKGKRQTGTEVGDVIHATTNTEVNSLGGDRVRCDHVT